jgi:Methyltransferase domain
MDREKGRAAPAAPAASNQLMVELRHLPRRVARSAGRRLNRLARVTSVEIGDYPLDPRPRWGHGSPPHAGLSAKLDRGRAEYSALLREFSAYREVVHAVPYTRDPSNPTRPFWDNIWFSALDAASLVALLLDRRPTRYFEIGSGHSTMFARHAVDVGALSTTITSLDPEPRASIDALCDDVFRIALEACNQSVFDELAAGDVLFFDGSHRVFTNSDVTAFFFDVLPRLAAGVLVHLHDIFLPWDYPPDWSVHFYSEQYLLGAMLLSREPGLRVVLPNFYVCQDPELSLIVKGLLRAQAGGTDVPFLYPGVPGQVPGVSFWLETTAS